MIDRFTRDLDALIPTGARIGIAVSGGPDSLALLLLAAAARARAGSKPPRSIMRFAPAAARKPRWSPAFARTSAFRTRSSPPNGRTSPHGDPGTRPRGTLSPARPMGEGAAARRFATAHHLDDQAETLLMRLVRGSGVRGLAGMRPFATVPGSDVPLLRPLLGWRRVELEQICAAAGLEPPRDPSNDDEQFERIRIRRALAERTGSIRWSLASSAANLGEAEAALEWATEQEWARAVTSGAAEILYRPRWRARDPAPHCFTRRSATRDRRRWRGPARPRARSAALRPREGRQIDPSRSALQRRQNLAFCSGAEPDSTCG